MERMELGLAWCWRWTEAVGRVGWPCAWWRTVHDGRERRGVHRLLVVCLAAEVSTLLAPCGRSPKSHAKTEALSKIVYIRKICKLDGQESLAAATVIVIVCKKCSQISINRY